MERLPASANPRPIAVVNGQALDASMVMPRLMEAAGGQVLEEWVLDRALEREVAAKRLVIDDQAIARERELLMDSIGRAGETRSDVSVDLLREVRRQRGLGEVRFAALLRRNASLRALVRDQVQVSDAQVRTEYEIEHGAKSRARIIVTPTIELAREVKRQLADLRGEVSTAFASLAQRFSTDASAAQGGAMGVVSDADPALPAGVRVALREVREGSASEPIALPRGFAVVLIEQRIAGDGVSFEQAAPVMRARARLAGERIEMERLARSILERESVSPLDPALNWSWQQRRSK